MQKEIQGSPQGLQEGKLDPGGKGLMLIKPSGPLGSGTKGTGALECCQLQSHKAVILSIS